VVHDVLPGGPVVHVAAHGQASDYLLPAKHGASLLGAVCRRVSGHIAGSLFRRIYPWTRHHRFGRWRDYGSGFYPRLGAHDEEKPRAVHWYHVSLVFLVFRDLAFRGKLGRGKPDHLALGKGRSYHVSDITNFE
jgi:hypothetical protein